MVIGTVPAADLPCCHVKTHNADVSLQEKLLHLFYLRLGQVLNRWKSLYPPAIIRCNTLDRLLANGFVEDLAQDFGEEDFVKTLADAGAKGLESLCLLFLFGCGGGERHIVRAGRAKQRTGINPRLLPRHWASCGVIVEPSEEGIAMLASCSYGILWREGFGASREGQEEGTVVAISV